MGRSLYICYFGIREPLVQTQVIPYLRELAKDGYQILLLTFESARKDAENGSRGAKEVASQLAADGIEWLWLPYHKRPSVPATAYDVLNGARFIRSLLAKDEINILHARSHVPMLMATLARKWSQRKPKLLFDIRGFFPEEYTDAGIWPEGGWLYSITKRVEHWLMKEADGFVVLTEKARKILFASDKGQVTSDKSEEDNPKSQIPNPKSIEVIPCCVDLVRFADANSDSRASIRRELGIGDRKVLVYVGAFGGWYMTDEMADLFTAFKSIEPNGFAMILTQSNPGTIEPILRQNGFLKNDLLITRVDSAEIPRYLSAADISVSLIKPCYSKQASSPTKNAEYLACGLPIIANQGIGDVDELIMQNRIGALIDDFTHDAYLRALGEIDALGDVGDRCRQVARREFDLETVGGARYRRIYDKLLDRSDP